MSATEIAGLIRHGLVSSTEVVKSSLDRLREVNRHINAVVRILDEDASRQAASADTAQRRGEKLPPLHGVPVTIKVNIDQEGLPTDNGIAAYRELIASEDNPVVRNFRDAGAIIVGRTNTPGYSMRWFTDNALHGLTLNPWNAGRTVGGSSGGAAASVAAGIVPIAHGNDIAGSVRYPAYCCGLVGLRPSYGRIPSFNATATGAASISSALMAVQGPLTRTVADNRLAFAAMSREDVRDPRWVPPYPPAPIRRPFRVARVTEGFGVPFHPAVQAALGDAGRALAAAGYEIEDIAPPSLLECAELWPQLAMPDVMTMLEPLVTKNGDEGIKRALALWSAAFKKYDARDALAALGTRLGLLRRWRIFLADYPLVLLPISTQLPFPVGLDVKSEEATAAIIAAQAPMMAISVLGLPGLAVPTGTHEGIPVGVQLVAAMGQEDLCFDAAETIEAHFPMATPLDLLKKP
ncbi:amidase [Bradyrhizobium sp. LTSP849]|nr:amidase [Bradyrhizobium sp. LTSP849]